MTEGALTNPFTGASDYRTPVETKPGLLARTFTNLTFYKVITFDIVMRYSNMAKRGEYTDAHWEKSSVEVLRLLESMGCTFEITGLDNLKKISGPVVYVANHMSTMETFLLPGILRPVGPVTFVVKEALLNFPIFGPIMRSRDPIPVGRLKPREDLVNVLKLGKEKLENGVSIVVFPQTTRQAGFDPEKFNSMGAKLAAKNNVKVVPIALDTSAWANGKFLKDFGPLNPSQKVHIAIGEPLDPGPKGDEAHQGTLDFIGGMMGKWRE